MFVAREPSQCALIQLPVFRIGKGARMNRGRPDRHEPDEGAHGTSSGFARMLFAVLVVFGLLVVAGAVLMLLGVRGF